MENKERVWKEEKIGYISSSRLEHICSASGKWIDGNLKEISRLRFQRKYGYSLYSQDSYPLRTGREQEPYAIEWFRANYPNIPITWAQEYEKIPFITVLWAKFGASPDALMVDGIGILQIKCLVGETQISDYSDETIPYEEKREWVLKEHYAQIIGELISMPERTKYYLLKYNPQIDDNELDVNPPTDKYRGMLFEWDRSELQEDIDKMTERIILCDVFCDSKLNRSLINNYEVVKRKVRGKNEYKFKLIEKCRVKNAQVTEAHAPAVKKKSKLNRVMIVTV